MTHVYVAQGAANKNVQEKLVEISLSHGLTQLQEEPTRGESILDLTFSTNPSLIKSITRTPKLSDHHTIVIDSIIRPQYTPTKKRKIFVFKKANWPALRSTCEKISKSIETRYKLGHNVVDLWDMFKSTLNLAIQNNIPSKHIRMNNDLPWVTRELKKLVKKKTKLHKKAMQTKQWDAFLIHQRICRKAFRQAEWEYVNSKIQTGLEQNNTKPFWSYIKSKRSDNM